MLVKNTNMGVPGSGENKNMGVPAAGEKIKKPGLYVPGFLIRLVVTLEVTLRKGSTSGYFSQGIG